ncbi:MAG: hypothetical protein JNK67_08405 [Alphaproteobacteria bacterium]|nr:hypothetical protein [Alphaproteobacteria bacterium]
MARPGLVALLLALGACKSPPGLEVSERAKPSRVDHIERAVPVSPQAPLRATDVVALQRGVNGFGPGAAVHASVVLQAGATPAVRNAIRRSLVEAGVPPTNIVFATRTTPVNEVVLHRYVVTPPECRSFSLDLNRTSQENPVSQLGCTNDRNLTQMVEDPRDLLHGRTLGPADAEHAANGVERYRGDEVKELLKPERLTTR